MHSLQSPDNFYADLPPFIGFDQITEQEHFHTAPDSWWLVITDIEGSTAAIAAGRYKEVNLIGAAGISAVLNGGERPRIGYLFGGDGATLLLPPDRLEPALQALSGLRALAQREFKLGLRVGRVSVGELRRAGCPLRVGKLQLSPGNYLTMLSGGAAELAERWIKNDPRYRDDTLSDPAAADRSGLSCRLDDLASQQGVMLSVLVRATAASENDQAAQYRAVLAMFNRYLASMDGGSPVRHDNLRWRWPPAGLASEIRSGSGRHPRWRWAGRVVLNSLIHYVLQRFGFSAGAFQPQRYREELRQNSDYRRFDDMLRLLIDCSPAQAEQIERWLHRRAERGELHYGTHRADRGLMTCVIFDLAQSEHIHFVDGAEGGFSLAAQQLKQRLSTSSSGPTTTSAG